MDLLIGDEKEHTANVAASDSVRLLAPVAYQMRNGSRVEIPGTFEVGAAGRLSFHVDKYDVQLPLVIDPVVAYADIIGVNNDTSLNAMAADSSGDIFLAGSTFGTNYPVVNGQGSIGSSGSEQVYLTKLDPTGTNILYSTYIPSPGFNTASAIALDANGNAFIAGVTSSPSFPTTSQNLGSCAQSCNAGFVAKFNSTGAMVYSTLIGSGQQLPRALAVDSQGALYVAGLTADSNLMTVNAYQSRYGAGVCGSCVGPFFAKLNSTGTGFIFASYFTASTILATNETFATAIAIDSAGNIYLAGPGTGVPLYNPLQSTIGGSFVAEFAPDGKTLLFSTLFGGETIQSDTIGGIQVGTDGTIYLAGSNIAPDFAYTLNAFQHPTYPYTQNIFASAINPAHTGLTYSTYIGQGFANATWLDANNTFYVAGSFSGSIPLDNAVDSDISQGGYILGLDHTGALTTSTEFGGHGATQIPTALTGDPMGNLYVAGAADLRPNLPNLPPDPSI